MSKNSNLRAKREKVKAQNIVFAQFTQHQNDYQRLHAPKVSSDELIAAWLATNTVRKCAPGEDSLRTFKKGAHVSLGDATPGRSCHVYGYRNVYSR